MAIGPITRALISRAESWPPSSGRVHTCVTCPCFPVNRPPARPLALAALHQNVLAFNPMQRAMPCHASQHSLLHTAAWTASQLHMAQHAHAFLTWQRGAHTQVKGLGLGWDRAALAPRLPPDVKLPAAAYEIMQANFVKSSSSVNQLPPLGGLEFAFTGRSNAGKSSLINLLTGSDSLAKVSRTPGKTRTLNHFLITSKSSNWMMVRQTCWRVTQPIAGVLDEQGWLIHCDSTGIRQVDCPGYGDAKGVSKQERHGWHELSKVRQPSLPVRARQPVCTSGSWRQESERREAEV